jgi:hypothetical protein
MTWFDLIWITALYLLFSFIHGFLGSPLDKYGQALSDWLFK